MIKILNKKDEMWDLAKMSITSDDIFAYLKQEIRLKNVCRKILFHRIITQAAQEREIIVTPEEIQDEADRRRHAKRLEKASDTLAWLEEEMITSEDWEAGIHLSLLRQKLAQILFSQEVESYFVQHKLDYEQVLLYQIVVPYEKVAQELFYQIEEKEISFYEAAHLYDIDERRRLACGCEGKIHRWNLQADVATVVFSAQPGEVTYPTHTEQGYHLFLVEEFLPAQLTPTRNQEIMLKLFKDWLNSELNYLLNHQLDNSLAPSSYY